MTSPTPLSAAAAADLARRADESTHALEDAFDKHASAIADVIDGLTTMLLQAEHLTVAEEGSFASIVAEATTPIEAANRLAAAMDAFRTDSQTWINRFKRNRVVMRWLIISVALDIALSLAAIIGGVIIHDLAQKANTQSSAAVVTCRAVNEFQSGMKAVFGPALKAAPPKDETPDQTKLRLDFIKFVNTPPKDCSKL